MDRIGRITASALTFALLSLSPARADVTAGSALGISVFYGDLDLSRPEGAAALVARLEAAAGRACGGEPDLHDPAGKARYRACTKAAVDAAVARIVGPTPGQTASRP